MTIPAATAAREIRKHTLLYADLQRLKSGEYEVVAASLVRRSVRRLVIGVAVSAWILFVGGALVFPIAITAWCVYDWIDTRATLRQVRALGHDLATRSGGSTSGSASSSSQSRS